MVLESLIGPRKAEKKPSEMLFIGFIYSSIAVLLSLWIFEAQASMIVVFLTVLACVPLMYQTIILEEKKDLVVKDKTNLLREHGKALRLFTFLFLGCVLSFTIWFIFLPSETVQTLFSTQLQTISAINARVTSMGFFSEIVINNFKVLFFCILFSFFYGAGAIFILTWNASVISAAIGTFIRNNLEVYATHAGFIKMAGYFHIFSLGLLRYLTHGILEILAYFIGGLAGGIISVAVIKHSFGSKQFKRVLLDAINLTILAAVIIVIAGLVEVFITPKLI